MHIIMVNAPENIYISSFYIILVVSAENNYSQTCYSRLLEMQTPLYTGQKI